MHSVGFSLDSKLHLCSLLNRQFASVDLLKRKASREFHVFLKVGKLQSSLDLAYETVFFMNVVVVMAQEISWDYGIHI